MTANHSEMWIDDKVELARKKLYEAIQNQERLKAIPPDSIDPEETMAAIDL